LLRRIQNREQLRQESQGRNHYHVPPHKEAEAQQPTPRRSQPSSCGRAEEQNSQRRDDAASPKKMILTALGHIASAQQHLRSSKTMGHIQQASSD
jgi:hypothetical protein